MPDLPDPNAPTCTGEETKGAVEYLISGFGPYYDDREQRQLKRLFLDYAPAEVREAIDQLIRQGAVRPRANELGHVLRSNRKFLVSQGTKTTPSYEHDEDAEAGVRHQIIAAIKAGDIDRVKGLTEVTHRSQVETVA